MHRSSATFRITLGLTMLSLTAMLVARALGVGPDADRAVLDGRRRICEILAVNSSMLLSRHDEPLLKASIAAIVERYPDILSVGVRRMNGQLLAWAGDHEQWDLSITSATSPTQVYVPLISSGEEWGALEARFRSLVPGGFWGWLHDPYSQLVGLMAIANLVIFAVYLRKTLQHLDPSRVVPERVRHALDTMACGLVILDANERIVLANKAFAAASGRLATELQGVLLSRLPWVDETGGAVAATPWQQSLEQGEVVRGVTLNLQGDAAQGDAAGQRAYLVHSSPIESKEGAQQGVLVSFEDVTQLEQSKTELSRTLDVLRASRDEVRRQNVELQQLATQDPLTGALNRRSFYQGMEVQWSNSQRYDQIVSCVMVDVDHFKSVNDNHGHSTGDLVLKQVATALMETVRPADMVCRFGGEEFCILLPHTNLKKAAQAAERYRVAIEQLELPGLSVTASFGVSSTESAESHQDLLDQADKALYAAKRSGRNRVMDWTQVPLDAPDTAQQARETSGVVGDVAGMADGELAVPFHAVSALISALAYRDTATAEHSRRVADLCAIVGAKLLPAHACYILETAALLHDIGKIGVPDSILLKPGPLTDEEWKIMGIHDRVGVEIIASAFSCEALTAIIENHHAWYEGNPREPELPIGDEIPLGARILAMADAYDAIVSDRVYRKGRSPEEAFAELRRCAGRQFDPQLVECFIESVEQEYLQRHDRGCHASRQEAVRFGRQMERLANALDNQDLRGLSVLSGQLSKSAEHCGEAELARAATALESAVGSDSEMDEIIRLATEVMSLCRSTQSAFIRNALLEENRSGGEEFEEGPAEGVSDDGSADLAEPSLAAVSTADDELAEAAWSSQ